MKMLEFQQRAEDGGTPFKDAPFEHGELVLVVSKRELRELLERAATLIKNMTPGVRHIVLQDYKELNDVPCDLSETLRQIKSL